MAAPNAGACYVFIEIFGSICETRNSADTNFYAFSKGKPKSLFLKENTRQFDFLKKAPTSSSSSRC